MTTENGIQAVGTYLPGYRLSADEIKEAWGSSPPVSSVSVPEADEDTLTMAVEAVENAFKRSSDTPRDIDYLGVATTTPPMEEGDFVSRMVRMLGLPQDVRTEVVSQDTAGGADVLTRAAEADGGAVAVASDAPITEPTDTDRLMGAGAVAYLFGPSGDGGVLGKGYYQDEYPGTRYRERGSNSVDSIDITSYERNAVTTVLESAVKDLSIEDVEGVAVHQPTAKMGRRIANSLPFEVKEYGEVTDELGDLGAATVPFALLSALSAVDSGESVVGVFYGGGRGIAIALEGVRVAVPNLGGGESLSYSRYLRMRGEIVDGEVSGGGAHISIPSWRSSLDARYRLAALECGECGSLTFPPRGACRSCGARSGMEKVELDRRGQVVASTVIGQGGAPPEFSEQQLREGEYGVVIVEVERGGESVWLPAQLTGCNPLDVEVGDEVEGVVRRIYSGDGVARYGLKFRPV